ncbi:MAG: GspH/FimT family pseudopilin [Plectolyngbya sp. WJT66-NPBG17]|jgi:prepilin-type N-terminal cleavage/methylation domain-containing protein|nr:GspH/FimT family pseudopilin [Plectolyngbya sp. WJT66-NPBG17]MBW4525448.1 GspH/FimT family pseudopilin [Phormidium tanganyikae FI6-MK23]
MKRRSSLKSSSVTDGFTLIEVLVTVILIGILFAIAAPNWVAFINQQRVGSARNQVSQALRSAQSEAQRTKVSRAVVFDTSSNPPRYAIVAAPNNTVDRSTINNWQTLGDGTIQSGTIRLSVNQGTVNDPPSLVFDSYGAVLTTTQIPYTVTIGSTLSRNPRRCVAVESLLGAIREASDGTLPDGCPDSRS